MISIRTTTHVIIIKNTHTANTPIRLLLPFLVQFAKLHLIRLHELSALQSQLFALGFAGQFGSKRRLHVFPLTLIPTHDAMTFHQIGIFVTDNVQHAFFETQCRGHGILPDHGGRLHGGLDLLTPSRFVCGLKCRVGYVIGLITKVRSPLLFCFGPFIFHDVVVVGGGGGCGCGIDGGIGILFQSFTFCLGQSFLVVVVVNDGLLGVFVIGKG
mmetsp:Transcript_21819/g.30631  ORF Transcript_21819/g.30631 Transcript_21819/m.30631 type:complete len:213 (-) Transcript_21819:980-1618(-)